jgi:uncharacterized SAM-binding protein YcdF (DUF218 family)
VREEGPAAEPFLGPEGVATLLLALAVAAGTLGLSLAAALWQVLRIARSAPSRPAEPARQALVLGTKLANGQPGHAFCARLDRALALSADQPGLGVVVLGGITTPGAPSEAAAGRRYLLAAGLPPDRIATEARSRHTLENLREFRAAFRPAGSGGPPVLLVTSRTHLARALLMARGLGLPALPCAAEAGRLPPREWQRLPIEAFLLHWYVVGRCYARAAGNRRMLARIS